MQRERKKKKIQKIASKKLMKTKVEIYFFVAQHFDKKKIIYLITSVILKKKKN